MSFSWIICWLADSRIESINPQISMWCPAGEKSLSVYCSVLHNFKTVGQEYLADFIGKFQYPSSFLHERSWNKPFPGKIWCNRCYRDCLRRTWQINRCCFLHRTARLPGGLLREVLRYGGRRRGGASLCPKPCPERGLGQAGGRGFWKGWQAIRLMPIKLVCLNLNRRETRQQPVPAYRDRPASQKNKKAAAKRMYISVRTQFNDVCTVHEMYVAICTRNISCTKLAYTGLYIVCTCSYDSKRVYTCLYWYIHVWTMYIHVWTMYIHVYTFHCTYHVRTVYRRVYTFSELYKHVHTCLYIFQNVHTCLNRVRTIALSKGVTYKVVWWYRRVCTRLCQVVRIPDVLR